ncbi:ClpP protease-like protein [Chryseobacterium sp. 52]|uniref:ATP-dependent Clp protease proteolytic subunit n=1 Tax=Chryseobacterium sp. 52 TaxID=2035213 RepID=UPI000C1A033B|nr:ATP-dependent Clp protease proteolytic subunit [Chryseobacterium sp. 52]PIF44296.1 ClpP protease-like protein [Chryseobacterium sp. 52]
MIHEINIYGDIVPFKWFNDGTEFDRADLNNLIDGLELNEGDELIYNIHTYGGCTTTAFAMYNKLKRVKNEKKITLTSRADGYCASSGVILLLAADKRIGSKYLKPFVHNAWTWVMGDKKEMKKAYDELEIVDNEIAALYEEETNITKELALELMSQSRDLTIEECKEHGFYTEIENVKIVENTEAMNSLISRRSEYNNKNNHKDMSDKNKKLEWEGIMKKVNNFFKSPGAKNKIIYTADNGELDFYELADDAAPKAKDGDTAGDKAKFDDKPAGDSNGGEYVMASGETYKFDGEELVEILPKEEEEEVTNDALIAENKKLKDQIKNLSAQNFKLTKEKGDQNSKITALNNEVTQAKEIITNFKNLGSIFSEEEEDDKKRNPKEKTKTEGASRVSNALGKFKKEN